MVQDVQTLMDEYDDTFEMSLKGKIHCKLTGHDFPYKLEEFKKYVATPKFIRAYELQKFEQKYAEHFEDIGNDLYGCKLTLRTIKKDPYSLNHHVNGIKFKNALKKHQEKLEKGDASSDTEKVDEEMPVEEQEEEVKPKVTKAKAGNRKMKAKQSADEEMPIDEEEAEPVITRKTRSAKKSEEEKVVAPKVTKSTGKRTAVVKQQVDEEIPEEDEEEDQPKADKSAGKRKKSSGTKRNSVKKARRS